MVFSTLLPCLPRLMHTDARCTVFSTDNGPFYSMFRNLTFCSAASTIPSRSPWLYNVKHKKWTIEIFAVTYWRFNSVLLFDRVCVHRNEFFPPGRKDRILYYRTHIIFPLNRINSVRDKFPEKKKKKIDPIRHSSHEIVTNQKTLR